jgi:hypothetical protein
MKGSVFGIAGRIARRAADAALRAEAARVLGNFAQGRAANAAVVGRRVEFLARELEPKLCVTGRLFVVDGDDAERSRLVREMPSCVFLSEAELLPYAISREGAGALDIVVCRPDIWSLPDELCSRALFGIRWSMRDSGVLVAITHSPKAVPMLRGCFGSVRTTASFSSGFPVFACVCRPLGDRDGGLEGLLS